MSPEAWISRTMTASANGENPGCPGDFLLKFMKIQRQKFDICAVFADHDRCGFQANGFASAVAVEIHLPVLGKDLFRVCPSRLLQLAGGAASSSTLSLCDLNHIDWNQLIHVNLPFRV